MGVTMKNLKTTPVSNNLTVYTSDLLEFFETIVLDEFSDEHEVLRTNDKNEALKNHLKMVKKFTISDEIINLSSLLKKANAEAQNFKDVHDGGSCNFDSVLLNLKGKRKDFIEKLEDNSGFSLSKISSGIWSGHYFVNFDLKGQAMRRTKMAETACKFLKENSIDAKMYYQLD